MEVVILAGGAGRRLRPITYWTPKPLFPVPGGTLLSRLIQQVAPLDPRALHVVTHHLADRVADVATQHPDVHVISQSPPFTLTGALATAARVVKDVCLILHADHYFSALPLHAIRNAPGMASTFFLETMSTAPYSPDVAAAAGCYLLSQAALQEIAGRSQEDTLATLVSSLQDSGLAVRWELLGGWRYDIDSVQDYLDLQKQLWTDPTPSGNLHSVWVAPSAAITDATLGPHVTVGPRAHLRNCALADAVVLADALVEDVRLQNVLAGPGPGGCAVLMFSGEKVAITSPADAAHSRQVPSWRESPCQA
ncbi:MAG: NTP transferase domain-containing protein [Chloroflexi bacterium]|nr:NTP transferase domain-containing protein [Chloroflexota bacterium]